MITRITNGNVLVNGKFIHTDVYFQGKSIIAIGGEKEYDQVIDVNGNYVSPGFIDIHCHGGGGADFADGDKEQVKCAAKTHLLHGTTSLFPTIVSADFKTLEKAIQAVEAVRDELPMLGGIHLEGPYFSPNQTGAQNGDALRKPMRDEYEHILKNYKIARWDYAPEMDENYEFLGSLLEYNVLPGAAHTDGTCKEMEEAAKRGCRLVTHLYSCTSTIKREQGFRIAGVVEATYLTDEISAELIADGCHLPHELLRLAYKLKGPDKLAFVTDGMRAAGMNAEGEFEIGGVPCIVEDGVAKLLDRSAFAGSIATTDRLVKTGVETGIPLTDTLKMMTETPARIMGLEKKGKIEVGYDADLVIFDKNIDIKTVILQGERVK